MSDMIITIGRENGSGGREVGKKLSEMLGIPCYDQEIITETAGRTGIDVKEIEKMEESNKDGLFSYWGIPSANPLFAEQSKIIIDLASKGPCIFVGRCADFILNGRKDVVKVFIHAPVGDRILRSAKRNGISEKEAYERIRKKDAQRASYYQRYSGRVWGAVSNYDLTVSTGTIGVEGAARLIIDYIEMAETGSESN